MSVELPPQVRRPCEMSPMWPFSQAESHLWAVVGQCSKPEGDFKMTNPHFKIKPVTFWGFLPYSWTPDSAGHLSPNRPTLQRFHFLPAASPAQPIPGRLWWRPARSELLPEQQLAGHSLRVEPSRVAFGFLRSACRAEASPPTTPQRLFGSGPLPARPRAGPGRTRAALGLQ